MIRACSTDAGVLAAWQGLGLSALSLALVGVSAAVCLAANSPAPPAAGESLALLPHTIVLRGPKARQAIVVERQQLGRLIGQATDGVVFESSDPKVVRVSKSVAVPFGDGKATIRARWKGHTAQGR